MTSLWVRERPAFSDQLLCSRQDAKPLLMEVNSTSRSSSGASGVLIAPNSPHRGGVLAISPGLAVAKLQRLLRPFFMAAVP